MTNELLSRRCIAFSNSAPQQHRCIVVDDNIVKVWDPIAGYFTTCNIIPPMIARELILEARARLKEVAQ